MNNSFGTNSFGRIKNDVEYSSGNIVEGDDAKLFAGTKKSACMNFGFLFGRRLAGLKAQKAAVFCAAFSFLMFFSVRTLHAQVQVNPNDQFYTFVQNWELRGLTDTLPQLRPYPLNVVQEILDSVIENGTDKDAQLAREEYERIFSRPWHLYAEANGIIKHSHKEGNGSGRIDDSIEDNEIKKSLAEYKENLRNSLLNKTKEQIEKETYSKTKKEKNLTGEAGIGGDIRFHPLVTVGYKLGVYAEKENYDRFSPYGVNKAQDSIFDPASIGPFESYLNWNTNIAIGTSRIYGAAGVSRTGYGPFHGDGLALNDTAYHSANFVLNYTGKKFSYSSVYETLGATNNLGETSNHWLTSGKYLAFHSIKYHLTDKIDVSYYENVIFGPRSNFAFLFPAPYMAIQNIGGANDNLQMGLLFEVKPFKGFEWATDIFVDDIELNEVVKGNFDTKFRVAGQTGFILAPSDSFCTLMGLNYTIVMPYTYAHWEYENSNLGLIYGSSWNYQNYTNAGRNIGSTLDPNSDKVSFYAKLNPTKNLSLDFGANFIRHSNSAEAFSDEEGLRYMLAAKKNYVTNGTASMHQMFSNESLTASAGTHVDSAWEKMGFMTSSHKMYVYQGVLNGEYALPKTKFGQLSIKVGYTFEYIKNAGINRNVYPGGLSVADLKSVTYDSEKALYNVVHADDSSSSYYWYQLKYSDDYLKYIKPAVDAARKDWCRKLYDMTNNYVSVGVKITF